MVTVRELTVDDVFAVGHLLGTVQIPQGKDPQQVGVTMLQSVLAEGGPEIKAWLADMCGLTPDELGKLPASTVLDVIEQLKAQEGIKDFFTRAARLAGLTPSMT